MDVIQLLHDVQQVAWNDTPVLTRKTPWLNYHKEIRELVSKKRKACKKWHQTRMSSG